MDAALLGELMESLLRMKESFEDQARSLGEQIGRVREHLRSLFDQQKTALLELEEVIDEKLVECCVYIEDYKRLYSNLRDLHARLSGLGCEALEMPEPLPAEHIEGIIDWRIRGLKSQGKI